MAVSIIPIIISIIAIGISGLSFYKTFKRDRLRDTIKAYTELQKYLYQYYVYPEGEIESYIDDRKSEEYKSLSNSLAQIEIFATGVRTQIYDFDVVFIMAHGFLDGSLRDRIEYMIDMKTSKHSDLYGNTKWLLEMMDRTSCKTIKKKNKYCL